MDVFLSSLGMRASSLYCEKVTPPCCLVELLREGMIIFALMAYGSWVEEGLCGK